MFRISSSSNKQKMARIIRRPWSQGQKEREDNESSQEQAAEEFSYELRLRTALRIGQRDPFSQPVTRYLQHYFLANPPTRQGPLPAKTPLDRELDLIMNRRRKLAQLYQPQEPSEIRRKDAVLRREFDRRLLDPQERRNLRGTLDRIRRQRIGFRSQDALIPYVRDIFRNPFDLYEM